LTAVDATSGRVYKAADAVVDRVYKTRRTWPDDGLARLPDAAAWAKSSALRQTGEHRK
jgi:hypothetical protein